MDTLAFDSESASVIKLSSKYVLYLREVNKSRLFFPPLFVIPPLPRSMVWLPPQVPRTGLPDEERVVQEVGPG